MNFAIVDGGGNVINVVDWDGAGNWIPPAGTSAVQSDVAGLGWTYVNGQFVSPPPPPPMVPSTVSSMQAKVALSRAGLLTTVQNWVNTQDAESQLIWNTAPSFSRNSALIARGAVALGLTSAQLDALFTTAANIFP